MPHSALFVPAASYDEGTEADHVLCSSEDFEAQLNSEAPPLLNQDNLDLSLIIMKKRKLPTSITSASCRTCNGSGDGLVGGSNSLIPSSSGSRWRGRIGEK